METSFQEFLEQKATATGGPERLRLRAEWLAALQRLYSQMESWLRESDPGNLLEFEVVHELEYDPALGTFHMPKMFIRIGEATIQVRPMGRKVIGSSRAELGPNRRVEGRVDVEERHDKVILYRVVDDSGDESWFVAGKFGGLAPLDHAAMESVLRDLWS